MREAGRGSRRSAGSRPARCRCRRRALPAPPSAAINQARDGVKAKRIYSVPRENVHSLGREATRLRKSSETTGALIHRPQGTANAKLLRKNGQPRHPSRLKQRLFCNSFLPPGALLAARPSQPTVQVSKYCILPPPPLISHTSSEKETPLHTQHVHVCIAVPFQSVPPAELQSCCCRCEGITFTVDKITSFEQLGSQQQQNRGWGSKDHFWCHWKSNTAVVSQHKEQLV